MALSSQPTHIDVRAETQPQHTFLLPVDSENKATVFRPWVFRGVHMSAFHASWLSFFVSMLSTFAPAALSVPIRDSLNLTDKDLLIGNILAICATVVSRVAMGSFCDTFGPKIGHTSLLLLTSVGVFSFGGVQAAVGHIVCRALIGLSLGTFVCCQYWSSVMFNVRIVGMANATGSGGGATGGGVTQALMPFLFSLLSKVFEPFIAWRVVLLGVGCAHILVALLILTCTQDLPTGSFAEAREERKVEAPSSSPKWMSLWVAVRNYRVWLLAVYYGVGVGIVFVLDNIITVYYYDNFEIRFCQLLPFPSSMSQCVFSYSMAGFLGSFFELVNVPTRLVGGFISDSSGDVFGMRGRLYVLWGYQIITFLSLIFLALSHKSLTMTFGAMQVLALASQGNQAAVFAVVPFISTRSLGAVSGIVGSFGTLGAVVLQIVYFNQSRFDTHEGFFWTGVTVFVSSFLLFGMRFPMWGGMLTGPQLGATEEEYYSGEYTTKEIEMGMAEKSKCFAHEAKSQRGKSSLAC